MVHFEIKRQFPENLNLPELMLRVTKANPFVSFPKKQFEMMKINRVLVQTIWVLDESIATLFIASIAEAQAVGWYPWR